MIRLKLKSGRVGQGLHLRERPEVLRLDNVRQEHACTGCQALLHSRPEPARRVSCSPATLACQFSSTKMLGDFCGSVDWKGAQLSRLLCSYLGWVDSSALWMCGYLVAKCAIRAPPTASNRNNKRTNNLTRSRCSTGTERRCRYSMPRAASNTYSDDRRRCSQGQQQWQQQQRRRQHSHHQSAACACAHVRVQGHRQSFLLATSRFKAEVSC